jgi:hypothetical protein
LNAGFSLFWYPIVGLGWMVLSFFGAVVEESDSDKYPLKALAKVFA